MIMRSWKPLPIGSASSWQLTLKRNRRPSISTSSISAVTCMPIGVAAAVGHLDPGPDRALLRREVGGERGDAGPFDKGDHLGGGEDRRHFRSRAKQPPGGRDGEPFRNPERRAVAQAGLQVVERHHPLYCRMVSPSLTSVRYISPSGAT